MPNWCDNKVVIEGPCYEISMLYVHAMRNNLLSYMCPEPDYKTTPVAKAFPEMAADRAKTEEEKKKALKNEPVIRENNQWDWRIQNWGTKWELDFDGQGMAEIDKAGKRLVLCFSSAWSPPIEAFQYYLDQNSDKDIKITARYYEGGCDFAGEFEGSTLDEFSKDNCYTLSDLKDEFFTDDPLGRELEDAFGILSWRTKCREDEEEREKQQKEKEAVNA